MPETKDLLTDLTERLTGDTALQQSLMEDEKRYDAKDYKYLRGMVDDYLSPTFFRHFSPDDRIRALDEARTIMRHLVFYRPAFKVSALRTRALQILLELEESQCQKPPTITEAPAPEVVAAPVVTPAPVAVPAPPDIRRSFPPIPPRNGTLVVPANGPLAKLDLRSTIKNVFDRQNTPETLIKALPRLLKNYKGLLDLSHSCFIIQSLGKVKRAENAGQVVKIRALLTMVAEHMNRLRGTISPENLCQALYALWEFPNEAVPRELMDVLLERSRDPEGHLTGPVIPRHVGMSVSGIRNLTEENVSPELFSLFTQMIQRAEGVFNALNLSSCLHGVRNFGDRVVSRAYLEAVAARLRESRDVFRPEQCSMSFLGLQNLGPDVVPPELIEALTQKMITPRRDWNVRHVAECLFGLQHLTPSMVPDAFFKFLGQKFSEASQDVNLIDISMALFGLAPFRDDPRAETVKKQWFWALSVSHEQPIDIVNTSTLTQAVHLHRCPMPEWLRKHYEIMCAEAHPQPNVSEKMALQYLAESHPEKTPRVNHYVDGFELDLYFEDERVNVEIDGRHHARRRLHDDRRDQYLKEMHQIRVIRVLVMRENFRQALRDLKIN